MRTPPIAVPVYCSQNTELENIVSHDNAKGFNDAVLQTFVDGLAKKMVPNKQGDCLKSVFRVDVGVH